MTRQPTPIGLPPWRPEPWWRVLGKLVLLLLALLLFLPGACSGVLSRGMLDEVPFLWP